MKHTKKEILDALKVIKDECKENAENCKKRPYSGCVYPVILRSIISFGEGCDLCRSGKQIIVYGVDYALDTKSEYHRIEPKFCPVCGRKLDDENHDKD